MINHPFVSRIGGVLSADIAVPKFKDVKRFYINVLCTGKRPLWKSDLMSNCGAPIIGLGEQGPDYADLPIQWMPHIQVSNVTHSVKHSLELGGKELLHGKGEDGSSLWAVILDPNGAAFGLIPIVSEEELITPENLSSHTKEKIGHISSISMTVSNTIKTKNFYQKVIGWNVKDENHRDMSHPTTDFHMLASDNKPAAAINHLNNDNIEIPPVWLIHLPVGNYKESLLKAESYGGKVIKEVSNKDGSLYSIIQDPAGAYISIFN